VTSIAWLCHSGVVRARVLACETLVASLLACCCFQGCEIEEPGNAACGVATSVQPAERTAEQRWTAPPSAAATIADLTDIITSDRAIAVRCGIGVIFLDPVTGAERETIAPVAAVGRGSITVVTTLLVDVEGDTLVVFLYNANHPQEGLTPARSEKRVEVHSRATGRVVLNQRAVLPGERDAFGQWAGVRIAGVDARGYLALNLAPMERRDRDVTYVLAVLPNLKSWSKVQDHPSLTDPSIRALAVHRGVLLLSRVADESAEVHGYDVTNGRRLWLRRFGVESLPIPNHPNCAVGHGDMFVVMGRWIPLALNVRTGRTLANVTVSTCMKIDPLRPNGAYGGSGRGGALVVMNLANGKRRWTIEQERSEALRLKLISVYDDRAYVTTSSGPGNLNRLVLDARTGKEIARDWTLAPIERHDGWMVAHDAGRGKNVVVPA
jgi:hypothetical protein